MTNRTRTVMLQDGLSNRAATFFVQKATGFPCRITVSHMNRTINAKSLLGVLSLGVAHNEKVVLAADGQDEELAVTALADFLGTV